MEQKTKTANSYYADQLAKVYPDLPEYCNIKISSVNGQTNWLSLNKESIPMVIKFLKAKFKQAED